MGTTVEDTPEIFITLTSEMNKAIIKECRRLMLRRRQEVIIRALADYFERKNGTNNA